VIAAEEERDQMSEQKKIGYTVQISGYTRNGYDAGEGLVADERDAILATREQAEAVADSHPAGHAQVCEVCLACQAVISDDGVCMCEDEDDADGECYTHKISETGNGLPNVGDKVLVEDGPEIMHVKAMSSIHPRQWQSNWVYVSLRAAAENYDDLDEAAQDEAWEDFPRAMPIDPEEDV
jgi:hypothetical protein